MKKMIFGVALATLAASSFASDEKVANTRLKAIFTPSECVKMIAKRDAGKFLSASDSYKLGYCEATFHAVIGDAGGRAVFDGQADPVCTVGKVKELMNNLPDLFERHEFVDYDSFGDVREYPNSRYLANAMMGMNFRIGRNVQAQIGNECPSKR